MLRRFPCFFTLVLLFAASLLAAAPLRIVPIGDSITQGRGSKNNRIPTQSWRYPFWKICLDHGAEVDFVGSLRGGFEDDPSWPDYGGQSFDRDHEGHWGWKTNGIRDLLPEWLAGYTPDVALILLGTNDWGEDKAAGLTAAQSAAQTRSEMLDIFGMLRDVNPEIVILLGGPFQEWEPFPDYRREYTGLARAASQTQSPVVYVPMHEGWVSDPTKANTDTVDWVHPNASGDAKLAARWWTALQPLLRGSFRNWQIARFDMPTAPGAGEDDDPDLDGYSNLLEYALALDPSAVDPTADYPQMQWDGANLTYTFRRQVDLDDVRYRLLGCPDAASWEDLLFDSAGPFTPNNSGLLHRASRTVTPGGHYFVRLEITRR